MRRCLFCKDKIEQNSNKVGPKRKYCSDKCKNKFQYKKNKNKYIENANNWAKNNPERRKEINKKGFNKFYANKKERFNELMSNNYKKNKDKYISRAVTFRIIFKRKKPYPIVYKCKKCNKKLELEIHHEEYPTRVKKIEKAISYGKIYFLCKKHHLAIHSKV